MSENAHTHLHHHSLRLRKFAHPGAAKGRDGHRTIWKPRGHYKRTKLAYTPGVICVCQLERLCDAAW